jgi:hypothetical protein
MECDRLAEERNAVEISETLTSRAHLCTARLR